MISFWVFVYDETKEQSYKISSISSFYVCLIFVSEHLGLRSILRYRHRYGFRRSRWTTFLFTRGFSWNRYATSLIRVTTLCGLWQGLQLRALFLSTEETEQPHQVSLLEFARRTGSSSGHSNIAIFRTTACTASRRFS